jgi:hypothetical protein
MNKHNDWELITQSREIPEDVRRALVRSNVEGTRNYCRKVRSIRGQETIELMDALEESKMDDIQSEAKEVK